MGCLNLWSILREGVSSIGEPFEIEACEGKPIVTASIAPIIEAADAHIGGGTDIRVGRMVFMKDFARVPSAALVIANSNGQAFSSAFARRI